LEQKHWEPNKVRIPKNKLIPLRVDFEEIRLRKLIKEAGGKWDREKRRWMLAYKEVLALGLEKRMTREHEVSNMRNIYNWTPAVKNFLLLETN
jgi:hypothetical protein